jgi:hypothetical protein
MPVMRFIGGPLHGREQACHAVPETFTVIHQGTDFTYQRRRLACDADDAPTIAVYAPPAMSPEALHQALERFQSGAESWRS